MKVRNMTSPKTGREIANQFVITDGEKTVFQSYDSTIIEIDRKNRVITVYEDWNYSMTTGKYRNLFMEENGFYGMADKKGFEHHMKLGEIGVYKVRTAF